MQSLSLLLHSSQLTLVSVSSRLRVGDAEANMMMRAMRRMVGLSFIVEVCWCER